MQYILYLVLGAGVYYAASNGLWVQPAQQVAPAVCDIDAVACGALKREVFRQALKDLTASRDALNAGLNQIDAETQRLERLKATNSDLQGLLRSKIQTVESGKTLVFQGQTYSRTEAAQQAQLLLSENALFSDRMAELAQARSKATGLRNDVLLSHARLSSILATLDATTAMAGATKASDLNKLLALGDREALAAHAIVSSVRSTAELSQPSKSSNAQSFDFDKWLRAP